MTEPEPSSAPECSEHNQTLRNSAQAPHMHAFRASGRSGIKGEGIPSFLFLSPPNTCSPIRPTSSEVDCFAQRFDHLSSSLYPFTLNIPSGGKACFILPCSARATSRPHNRSYYLYLLRSPPSPPSCRRALRLLWVSASHVQSRAPTLHLHIPLLRIVLYTQPLSYITSLHIPQPKSTIRGMSRRANPPDSK